MKKRFEKNFVRKNIFENFENLNISKFSKISKLKNFENLKMLTTFQTLDKIFEISKFLKICNFEFFQIRYLENIFLHDEKLFFMQIFQ